MSYANRGMLFEEMINKTNDVYLKNGKAVIHKKPTPIQVVKMKNGRIIDGFFKKASTTDYNGVYKGKYIDFDAKECKNKTSFPLSDVQEHQYRHLMAVKEQGGYGFLLIYMKSLDKVFLLKATALDLFFKRAENGRKSISVEELEHYGEQIPMSYPIIIPYLDVIDGWI